jgi:protein-S-isoprenylcysteine O-methyltransferase Ste14
MITWEVLAFVAASLALGYLSRGCLLHPRSHGFYRFFAWEAMAALFLLNVSYWFDEPFSAHQLVSWALLTVSVFPVVAGLYLLRRKGRPDDARGEPGLLGWEKTTELVTAGVYRYIRHPMYCSLLLLAWGIFFKAPSWPGGGLVAAATLFLWLTARVEEAEDVRYFGAGYQEYMRRTWMFVPFIV